MLKRKRRMMIVGGIAIGLLLLLEAMLRGLPETQ